MFYWHCSAHNKSRWLIKGLTIFHCSVIALGQYRSIQTVLIIALIYLISHYALYHHARLPVVISYHKDFWRCLYQDRIIRCDLLSGFVLGPIALLRLRPQQNNINTITIGMMHWDVNSPEGSQAGNWNQLRTILSYSQRRNRPESDTWLSG